MDKYFDIKKDLRKKKIRKCRTDGKVYERSVCFLWPAHAEKEGAL